MVAHIALGGAAVGLVVPGQVAPLAQGVIDHPAARLAPPYLGVEALHVPAGADLRHEACDPVGLGRIGRQRSEEHTSELQSLMRISYAVFCLKKHTPRSSCLIPDHMSL